MTGATGEEGNYRKNKGSKFKSITIIIILSIAISLAILFFGLKLLFGLSAPFFEVISDSMVPALKVNDMMIVKGGNVIPFSSLKLGDIIVFHSPYNSSQVIVHRIIDQFQVLNTTIQQPQTIIRTQGDASTFSIFGIDYPIREHNYIGKVVYHISNTDPLFNILRPPVIQIIILAVISVIVGSSLYAIFTKIQRKRKGEIKQP